MSEETKLKPCPFCGGEAAFGVTSTDEDDPNFGGRFIECTNEQCGITTRLRFLSGDDPDPLLAEVWNRRS